MWRSSSATAAMRSVAQPTTAGRLFHSQTTATASAVRKCGPVAIAAQVPAAVLKPHSAPAARSTAFRTAISSSAAPRRCFSHVAARHSAASSSAPSSSASPAADSAVTVRPGGWVCPLPDEAVLRLSASASASTPLDLLKFLHNLATCDVYALAASGGAGYTVFLNARGRVMFDACLQPIDEASRTWMAAGARPGTLVQRGAAGIDRAGAMLPTSAADFPAALSVRSATPRGFYLTLPRASVPLALDHLRQYNLRRKVVVDDVSAQVLVSQIVPFGCVRMRDTADPPMTAATMLGVSDAALLQPNASLLHAMIDPRCPQLGVRVLTRRDSSAGSSDSPAALPFLPASYTVVSDPTFFDAYRILQGIPRAPLEIQADKSLPLELGLLDMGRSAAAAVASPVLTTPTPAPVSFEKGCYLGQELTARTHFQGVVRKRIWPLFALSAAAVPSSAASTAASAEQIAALQGKSVKEVNASNLAAGASATAAATPSAPAAAPGADAVTAAAFRELQSFFPLFDPSSSASALLLRDTPIVRAPVSAAASAPAALSKEVARVLSSQHNVCLALLRSEHVEDHAQILQTTAADASAGSGTILLPFQPEWWTASAAEPAAVTAASSSASAPGSSNASS